MGRNIQIPQNTFCAIDIVYKYIYKCVCVVAKIDIKRGYLFLMKNSK